MAEKMRGLVYTGPGKTEIRTVPKPAPKDDEHLVKVAYSGICGTDLAITAGKHPRTKPPLIPGHEISGTIAIPAKNNPRGLKTGAPVVVFPLLSCGTCFACRHSAINACRILRFIGIDCDGGMAEDVAVPDKLLFPLPPEISLRDAALIEPMAVAIRAAGKSGARPEDCVVVAGAGPIGLLQALVLRAGGVKNLTILDINPYRLEAARKMGFEAFDSRDSQNVLEIVNRKSNAEGADVLFEASGAAAVAAIMTELVRPLAKIIMVSVFKTPALIDLRSVNFKEISILGTRVYLPDDYQRALEILLGGSFPAGQVVTHEITLEETPEMLQKLLSGTDALKVLVKL